MYPATIGGLAIIKTDAALTETLYQFTQNFFMQLGNAYVGGLAFHMQRFAGCWYALFYQAHIGCLGTVAGQNLQGLGHAQARNISLGGPQGFQQFGVDRRALLAIHIAQQVA